MPEYIEREAALKYLYNSLSFAENEIDLGEFRRGCIAAIQDDIGNIANLPAADVAEVKHGEWIEETFETLIPVEFDENDEPILHKHIRYKCSVCGRKERYKELFCHCGAKMHGN